MKATIIIFLLLFTTNATAQIDEFFTMFESWNLKFGIVNGQGFSVPVNDEVYPITISFSDAVPNYSTTVCGTASGEMATKNGFILMFTSEVVITDELCNLASNNSFQDIYFEFFILHNNEALNYQTIIVDFAPSQEPEYVLIIMADNGDELFLSDIPLLEINPHDITATIVYPNPTDNYIQIESIESRDLDYNLFSYEGKLLGKGSINTEAPIDVSEFSSGNYLLVLADDAGRKVIKKIVKN